MGIEKLKNKAGYTAQDAPSTRLKKNWRRTDGPTDGPTDGRTDTPSYRDATAHLKAQKIQQKKFTKSKGKKEKNVKN